MTPFVLEYGENPPGVGGGLDVAGRAYGALGASYVESAPAFLARSVVPQAEPFG